MDNLGNTESRYFSASEPLAQQAERVRQKNKIKAASEFLDDLIKRLEERITFYDSVNSIQSDVTTTPEEHLREVITNQKTADNLRAEKGLLEGIKNSV